MWERVQSTPGNTSARTEKGESVSARREWRVREFLPEGARGTDSVGARQHTRPSLDTTDKPQSYKLPGGWIVILGEVQILHREPSQPSQSSPHHTHCITRR